MRRTAAFALTLTLLGTAAPAFADYPPNFKPTSNAAAAAANNNFAFTVDGKKIKVSVSRSAKSKGTVSLGKVKVGQFFALRATALPKNTDAVLKVIIDGSYVTLGTNRTSSTGKLQFPGLSFGDAGKYTLVVVLPGSGMTYLFKVVVA